MESKGELKEIDIKNRTCYYSDDIIKGRIIYSVNILLKYFIFHMKHSKIFEFITFHLKL